MRVLSLISFCVIVLVTNVSAQDDKAIFENNDLSKSYYHSTILKNIDEYKVGKSEPGKKLTLDLSERKLPTDVKQYRQAWHNKPISQGSTGTCWCFSTISMIESDLYRLNSQQVKLSEMYIVYWEYVEKARRFVQQHGNSLFGEGSEANAVMRIAKQYGVVQFSEYSGKKEGQTFYDHRSMYSEMNAYLQSVKSRNEWNEEHVIETIKSILNYHMGVPPTMVSYKGQKVVPTKYMSSIGFIPDDYVDILSYMQQEYMKKVEYQVPDNWWHSKEYNNVPLDDFTRLLKKALLNGFTVSIGGDISEAGFVSDKQVAVIPSFDIPSEHINEAARQFRFSNKSTTDDHGMHLVGMKKEKDDTWYLIKDSGSGSRKGGEGTENFGYYFFHEDYVKLKMMDFCVHKEAVAEILKEIK